MFTQREILTKSMEREMYVKEFLQRSVKCRSRVPGHGACL